MDTFKQVQTAYDQMVSEYAKRNHSNMADTLVVLAHDLIWTLSIQLSIFQPTNGRFWLVFE